MQIPLTFQTAGPFNLGGGEIIVIAVVFLVLFGGKKLPEMAKVLVRASRSSRMLSRNNKKNRQQPSPQNRPSLSFRLHHAAHQGVRANRSPARQAANCSAKSSEQN